VIPVFFKEMSDNFGRRRFLLIEGIIIFAAMWAGYVAIRSIRGEVDETVVSDLLFLNVFTSDSGFLPSFLFFVSFFGPLIAITLGFDTINGERTQGTLARVLAQPIYRDALFNGKFLAGVTTITVIVLAIDLLIIGLGMSILEFPPSDEALIRIGLFSLITVVYLSFWLAVAMLTSVWFRSAVASALTSLALWLFFGFVVLMLSGTIAEVAVRDTSTQDLEVQQVLVRQTVARISPVTLFQEATSAILDPTTRNVGPVLVQKVEGLQAFRPLPIADSVKLVWPHFVVIFALTGICFGLSYIRFLREEVRA